MASDQTFVDYVMDQLSSIPGVSSRKMFGEYAIYIDSKIIGLICDNQLYVKPTNAGRGMIVEPTMSPPYQGAKPYFLIGDKIDQREWLIELVLATANEVPLPAKKKTKNPVRTKKA